MKILGRIFKTKLQFKNKPQVSLQHQALKIKRTQKSLSRFFDNALSFCGIFGCENKQIDHQKVAQRNPRNAEYISKADPRDVHSKDVLAIKKAARQGHGPAYYQLGIWYQEGLDHSKCPSVFCGNGLDRDPHQAYFNLAQANRLGINTEQERTYLRTTFGNDPYFFWVDQSIKIPDFVRNLSDRDLIQTFRDDFNFVTQLELLVRSENIDPVRTVPSKEVAAGTTAGSFGLFGGKLRAEWKYVVQLVAPNRPYTGPHQTAIELIQLGTDIERTLFSASTLEKDDLTINDLKRAVLIEAVTKMEIFISLFEANHIDSLELNITKTEGSNILNGQ